MSLASLEALAESNPRQALLILAQELHRRNESTSLDGLYPDEGPLRRELYAKHVALFEAGKIHNERFALGGNRVGKTLGIGGYETAVHMTGLYPEWWAGHRYQKRILSWAAGTKNTKVRDVNQQMLLGANFFQGDGSGLIPRARIKWATRKSGVPGAVEQILVRHVDGYENQLVFKSYEEGRKGFEAEAVDWIWLDEEPAKDIYDECLLRLLTTRGRVLSTLTPVEGMTEHILAVLEDTDILSTF